MRFVTSRSAKRSSPHWGEVAGPGIRQGAPMGEGAGGAERVLAFRCPFGETAESLTPLRVRRVVLRSRHRSGRARRRLGA
eukprot:5659242-Prymnesium_polylepis.2